jgi:hypothetical protein
VQGPRHVIQRLPRPSAYQQVKLRQSWSPVLWKTSGVGTDASVRAGWLDRPRSASRCKLISVLPRDFSGQHLLRLRPVVMEVIHLAWDHRASRGSAARTLLSRRLHIAYFVQPRPPHPCAMPLLRSTTPQVSSVHKHYRRPACARRFSRSTRSSGFAHACQHWTGISPQRLEIG